MSKKPSYAEIRRMRERLKELEENARKLKEYWVRDFPGTHIGRGVVGADTFAAIETAMKLNHAVIARRSGNGTEISYWAVSL